MKTKKHKYHLDPATLALVNQAIRDSAEPIAPAETPSWTVTIYCHTGQDARDLMGYIDKIKQCEGTPPPLVCAQLCANLKRARGWGIDRCD